MDKSTLADQLRERQRDDVPADILPALSDDQVIACYITCAHCGVQQITDEQADQAITVARSAVDFMRLWPQLAKHKCDDTPMN